MMRRTSILVFLFLSSFSEAFFLRNSPCDEESTPRCLGGLGVQLFLGEPGKIDCKEVCSILATLRMRSGYQCGTCTTTNGPTPWFLPPTPSPVAPSTTPNPSPSPSSLPTIEPSETPSKYPSTVPSSTPGSTPVSPPAVTPVAVPTPVAPVPAPAAPIPVPTAPVTAPSAPPSKLPSQQPSPAPRVPVFDPILINAGGSAINSGGMQWLADNYFQGGKEFSKCLPDSTNIYCTERYFKETEQKLYEIPVPSGDYDVRLHFQEIFYDQPGRRIFDVMVEDAVVYAGLDLVDVAGYNVPFVFKVPVTVVDGFLTVEFVARTQNPKISGLEIRPRDETSPVAVPITAPIAAPVPVPIQAPVLAPVEAPLVAPVEPVSVPIQAPAPDPSQAPRQIPSAALSSKPSPAPAPTPVASPVLPPAESPVEPSIIEFYLIDTTDGTVVQLLKEGDSVDISAVGDSLSIRAEISAGVDSVKFSWDGQEHTEYGSPWAMWGNFGESYTSVPYFQTAGSKTVTVSAFNLGEEISARSITFAVVGSSPRAQPFLEEDGIVVMEAESVPVASPWVFETEKPGFSGTGYFVFSGNSVMGGSPNGTLKYFFEITSPGIYQLTIRSNKNDTDATLANDCYTKLVGYDGYQGQNVKTYMNGAANEWAFRTKHEYPEHVSLDPLYNITAPGVYELQVSGRSKNFFIDRIVLFDKDRIAKSSAENLGRPESQREQGPAPVAPAPVAPVPAPVPSPVSVPVAPAPPVSGGAWIEYTQQQTPTGQSIDARHEACFVMVGGRGVLVGGRGIRDTDIFDPTTRTWTKGAELKNEAGQNIEVHHMQCVEADGKLWIVSAWTGGFPREKTLPNMFVYDPIDDSWEIKPGMPENRRRGGSAVVVVGEYIYVSHGNIGGHQTDDNPATSYGWLDRYNRITHEWVELADAPNPRDHTGGAYVNGRICVAGGRNGGENRWPHVAVTDCYDPQTNTWTEEAPIPNSRAGSAYGTSCEGKLIVAGGEGGGQAWRNVDVFDGTSWSSLPDLNYQRHGTGLAVDCQCNQIHIASGAGNEGGGPELTSLETWYPSGKEEGCVHG